jgi:hypothetical protein
MYKLTSVRFLGHFVDLNTVLDRLISAPQLTNCCRKNSNELKIKICFAQSKGPSSSLFS